jgi:hypothetical protein
VAHSKPGFPLEWGSSTAGQTLRGGNPTSWLSVQRGRVLRCGIAGCKLAMHSFNSGEGWPAHARPDCSHPRHKLRNIFREFLFYVFERTRIDVVAKGM